MKKLSCFVLIIGLLLSNLIGEGSSSKLSIGEKQLSNIQIECWDDFSIRISDINDGLIIFKVIDEKTQIETLEKVALFLEDEAINSVNDFIDFLEDNKLTYSFDKLNATDKYYVKCQSFFENYLVKKYDLKSGLNSGTGIIYTEWDELKNFYKNKKEFNEDSIKESLNFNGIYYDTAIITYNSGKITTFTMFDVNTASYTRTETLYPDGRKRIVDYDGDNYERIIRYDSNGKVRIDYDYDIINKVFRKVEIYNSENKLTNFYSEPIKVKNTENQIVTQYRYMKSLYDDYSLQFIQDNWNVDSCWFDTVKMFSTDMTQPIVTYFDYDKSLKTFSKKLFKYSDHIKVYTKPDTADYYNVDVYDNAGKLICYSHIIKPWDDEKKVRDVEVLSDGIVYKYFDVKTVDENDMLEFRLCEYTDINGKKIKIKNGKLAKKDFYKKVFDEKI